MASHVLRTDGGARGNPGPAGAAFVLEAPEGTTVCSGGRYLGETTNNVAEYEALVWGLECAKGKGVSDISILADSELVVRQLTGVYKVKNAGLRPLHARAMALLAGFGSWSVAHVGRSMNAEADALVNAAIDARGSVGDAAESPALDGRGTLF